MPPVSNVTSQVTTDHAGGGWHLDRLKEVVDRAGLGKVVLWGGVKACLRLQRDSERTCRLIV